MGCIMYTCRAMVVRLCPIDKDGRVSVIVQQTLYVIELSSNPVCVSSHKACRVGDEAVRL
jgi:hypothetical protein